MHCPAESQFRGYFVAVELGHLVVRMWGLIMGRIACTRTCTLTDHTLPATTCAAQIIFNQIIIQPKWRNSIPVKLLAPSCLLPAQDLTSIVVTDSIISNPTLLPTQSYICCCTTTSQLWVMIPTIATIRVIQGRGATIPAMMSAARPIPPCYALQKK